MNRIEKVMDEAREMNEKEITWSEAKTLLRESGFQSFPAIMALMDQVNKEMKAAPGQTNHIRSQIMASGHDTITMTITNRSTPICHIRMSLPGMVAALSQMKR